MLTESSRGSSSPTTRMAVAGEFSPYAALRETHSGVVILLGDRAYKVKKPVNLGFLDFSTRELRLRACRREVELNRRLAPDVYLGVADVIGPDGSLEDHMVEMKRMPDQLRLSTLVRSGVDVDDAVRTIAREVAGFHARCARSDEITAGGSRDALQGRWEASFTQVRPFVGSVLAADTQQEIESLTLAYLAGRETLFERRAASGAVVDGHGDLMTDDIFCLPDGPRILDCLEFDDALRHLDQIDDAAFLAMDLERIGAGALAGRFLDWYREFGADNAPPSLIDHYIAYRAFVRAKVACVRHAQGDTGAGSEARWFADLALAHLRESTVTLGLVGGPPGTGKTTVAGGVADELGLTVLSSDRVRKELAGITPTTSAAAPLGEGLYSHEWSERVYAELLRRAERLLSLGESVVLDATWSNPRWREAARGLADACSARFVALRCAAPQQDVVRRTAERREVSDADPAIAQAISDRYPEWPGADTVDTRETREACVRRAACLLRPAHGTHPRVRSRIAPD